MGGVERVRSARPKLWVAALRGVSGPGLLHECEPGQSRCAKSFERHRRLHTTVLFVSRTARAGHVEHALLAEPMQYEPANTANTPSIRSSPPFHRLEARQHPQC